MKNRILITALATGLLVAGGAYACGGKDPGKMFDKIDSNGDGVLSADELKTMHEKMAKKHFDRADANGDGKIDKNEFMAKAKDRAAKMFERMDKNGDGTITDDEAGPRHHGKHGDMDSDKSHFDPMQRMDTNGDGKISRDEWNTAFKQHHLRHPDDAS